LALAEIAKTLTEIEKTLEKRVVSTKTPKHSVADIVLTLNFKPPQPKPLPRRFELGGYEYRSLLGAGGFAVAVLAVDKLGRSWVLKIPHTLFYVLFAGAEPTATIDPRELKALQREYEALRRLRHPHIVKLGHRGKSDPPYLAVEFCENGSAAPLAGRLRFRDVVLIGAQTADALAYAHKQGVVHHDVKPGNLLFTREGLLKVSDFGAAWLAGVSGGSTRVYSRGYAAPEQVFADAGDVGPWSDVWMLGATLYALTVGGTILPLSSYEDGLRMAWRRGRLVFEAKLGNTGFKRLLREVLTVEVEDRPSMVKLRDRLAELYFELS